jgi:adenine-specific DNA-methyltransferase
LEGSAFTLTKNYWKTNQEGMERLRQAERLFVIGNSLRYVRFLDEVPARPLTNIWTDTGIAGYGDPKVYAVQTNTKVIERCILMTTDPGDLVFDPTCGSGTTAWCAEKWGRRWITCDTSRVALAIARQRLMTAKFDYYELKDPERGPVGGFNYETVPHITLESIAKNDEIDAIANRYQPQIDQELADLNRALGKDWKEWEVPREVPHPVWPEEAKQAYRHLLELKRSGKLGAEKEAEPLLETVYRLTGHRWENLGQVPDPVPPEDWPDAAKDALRRFWELKRQKRKEIDESIKSNASQETLYDRPKVVRGVVRVTGPFTVEAIPVPAVEDPTQAPIPQSEDSVGAGSRASPDAGQPQGDAPTTEPGRINDRGGDYLTMMINLLKKQGSILFPRGKRLELANIQPLNLGYLHAEAEGAQNGKSKRVVVSFGPQYGPVTASQTDEAIRIARRAGYDILILAGFSIEASAQAMVQEAQIPGLDVHFANVAPDVLMQVEETQGKVSLLKTTRDSQIFTVFGQPDVRVDKQEDGTYRVELSGVDIYDPLTGNVESKEGKEVAAWFLDTDYDGKTFHLCQAFFPGAPDAWEKLQRALKAQIPPEVFEQMRGTVSFPFQPGEHQRIAVKVIDFRGNEVVRVIPLNAEQYR